MTQPPLPETTGRNSVPGRVPARRIAGNFGFLTLFKLLSDAFTFVLFVAISRKFGQEGVGEYSFAVGIASGFAVLADLGLYRLSIKDLARRDGEFAVELASLLVLRGVLTLLVLASIAVVAWLLTGYEAQTRRAIFVVGLHLTLYTVANGLNAVFIARLDMALAASVDFAAKAVAACAGVTLALLGFDLLTVLWALPGATMMQVIVSLVMVWRRYGGVARPDAALVRRIVRDARPFFTSAIVRYVTIRSDVVLLGALVSIAAAGVYNVAYRVVFLLLYLPQYAALAIFPVISRMHHEADEARRELIQSALGWMLLIGVPASTGLCLVAPQVIELIYGPAFDTSVLVLQILAWIFLLACLRNVLSTVLTACDQQTLRTRLESVAAVIAVIGNVVLIVTFGPKGAAAATLGAEAVLVLMLIVATWPMLDVPRLLARLLIGALASGGFTAAVLLLPRQPLYITIPAAIALYAAVIVAFPTIRVHEWHTLKAIAKR